MLVISCSPKTEGSYCRGERVSKDMNPHAIFGRLPVWIIAFVPEEQQEVSVFLLDEEGVEHLFNVCIKATVSWRKRVRIPNRLLVRSGPEKSILFRETPSVSAAESKTTRIFPGFREWYTAKLDRYKRSGVKLGSMVGASSA